MEAKQEQDVKRTIEEFWGYMGLVPTNRNICQLISTLRLDYVIQISRTFAVFFYDSSLSHRHGLTRIDWSFTFQIYVWLSRMAKMRTKAWSFRSSKKLLVLYMALWRLFQLVVITVTVVT